MRLMANDRVIMRSDFNVSCLDTLGYVMPGNSRLARGYQDSVGTRHSHLQSRIDEKNIWKGVSHCIGNSLNNMLFSQFGTPQCIQKHTFAFHLNENSSQRNTECEIY